MTVPPGESLLGCENVVRGRRKRMFGSKTIVRDKRPRPRPRGNMTDKMAIGLGGSKVEPATVQMDDRLVRPPIRGMHPKPRYAADCVCFACHLVARQYALHANVAPSARLDSS